MPTLSHSVQQTPKYVIYSGVIGAMREAYTQYGSPTHNLVIDQVLFPSTVITTTQNCRRNYLDYIPYIIFY